MRIRAFSKSPKVPETALPPARPESDEERAFADWDIMRRVVMTYLPLLALAPILAGVLLLVTD